MTKKVSKKDKSKTKEEIKKDDTELNEEELRKVVGGLAQNKKAA
jgi:hypothetical protein